MTISQNENEKIEEPEKYIFKLFISAKSSDSVYAIKNIKKLYFSSILTGLFILLAFKHLEKFQIQYLILNKKIYSYENIIKIGNYNNVEFYQSTNSQCLDFIKVCVNQPKKKYGILSKFGYKIYLSEDF